MTRFLPAPPRIRMSVQSKTKETKRPLERFPCFRAGIFRELDPRRDALQLRLPVSLRGICLLEDVAGQQGVGVDNTRRLHVGGCSAKLTEESCLVVLVDHSIAFKDDTAFKFSGRMVGRKLGVLLSAEGKQMTKMALLHTGFGTIPHSASIFNEFFVPAPDLTQPLPLLLQGGLSGRSLPNLRSVRGGTDEAAGGDDAGEGEEHDSHHTRVSATMR